MPFERLKAELVWVGRLGGLGATEINFEEFKEQRRHSIELDALTPFPFSLQLDRQVAADF